MAEEGEGIGVEVEETGVEVEVEETGGGIGVIGVIETGTTIIIGKNQLITILE